MYCLGVLKRAMRRVPNKAILCRKRCQVKGYSDAQITVGIGMSQKENCSHTGLLPRCTLMRNSFSVYIFKDKFHSVVAQEEKGSVTITVEVRTDGTTT